MRGLLFRDNELFTQSYQGFYKVNLQENSIQNIEIPGSKLGNAIISTGSNILFGSYQKPLVLWNSLTNQYKILRSEEKLEFQSFELINGKKIWTGTQKGVFEVDLENLTVHPGPINSGLILDIHENEEFIYLASSEGLVQISKKEYPSKKYFFENERISHIYEDEKGVFWISTRGSGLIKWNPLTKESKFYNTKTGFSNNFIHCAYPDSFGNLWLTSNFGLIRFNKELESVQTFFKKDGLSDDEFNILSHFQGSDGALFFGGLNGITWFHPNDFKKEADKPTPLIIISSKIFSLNNGIYEWRSSDFPLKIKSTDAYAEIGVSPLIYEEDPYYQFSWRIKELQNNWVVQNSSIIRLNNLPHGNYTLQIKYSKSGNSISSDQLEIPLEISQPLLLRSPFMVLYILTIVGLGILIARTKTRALIRSNKRLESEVEKRTLLLEKRTKEAESDRETIRLQSEELKMMDELKTNFFANITHELRTPLTLILGPLERLINAKKDPDGSLAVVHRNGLRLMNLVEELLDLSKIEAKKIDLNEKPLNLYVFLNSCISNFETFSEQKGIQIEFEFGIEKDATFLLDEKKLEKIITNLLSNAIKHTPPKGSISIQVKKEGARIKIIVSDTGKGIIASDLPFVFERYFQSKEDEKLQGGTGIGLALSREYVKAMGGDIAVESEVGQGATFTVTLIPKTLDSKLPLKKKKQSTIRHTILIVDDQVDIQWHIKNLLEKEYQILTANNGKEALTILQNEKVDLAIVDIMMPIMDGYELLKIIRSQNFDFPIIFLTALSDLSKQSSALRMGVDDYLTKPFQELELKSRIRNLITRYETRNILRMNPDFSLDIPTNPGEPLVSFDQKWMAKLEKTILENLKHPDFTIQMLAEQLNVSKRNLYYKIEAYTGMTPNQFLTEIRLLEARKLLENRVYETVAEVCYAVGFTTTRYFSKLFNERFGKFPSDYKNSPH
jgi:signal transduction histidine kinase/DNA-binding response OmpR family regulator